MPVILGGGRDTQIARACWSASFVESVSSSVRGAISKMRWKACGGGVHL